MPYRSRSPRLSLLALSLGLLAAGPLQSQSLPATPLTGRWKLNTELSDPFEEKLRDALRAGVFYGAAAGGGRRARPPASNRDQATEDRELANLVAPVLQLLIRQDEGTVSISDAGGQMQPFSTDGRKLKETLLSGGSLETQARWKDAKLVIERKQDKTGTVREAYFVEPVSGKLVVEIKLSSNRLPKALEFRRVYDPATGS